VQELAEKINKQLVGRVLVDDAKITRNAAATPSDYHFLICFSTSIQCYYIMGRQLDQMMHHNEAAVCAVRCVLRLT